MTSKNSSEKVDRIRSADLRVEKGECKIKFFFMTTAAKLMRPLTRHCVLDLRE